MCLQNGPQKWHYTVANRDSVFMEPVHFALSAEFHHARPCQLAFGLINTPAQA